MIRKSSLGRERNAPKWIKLLQPIKANHHRLEINRLDGVDNHPTLRQALGTLRTIGKRYLAGTTRKQQSYTREQIIEERKKLGKQP